MSNKIAVLMHPHYSSGLLSHEDYQDLFTLSKDYTDTYIKALENYKTSIIYLPKIEIEIAKEIIIENIDILLEYYYNNKVDKLLSNYFGIPTIPYFISVVDDIFKIPSSTFKIKNKSYIRKFDNRNKKDYLKNKIVSNIDIIFKYYPKFTSIISGVKDFNYNNEILINNLERKLEKNKNIFIYSLGGVSIIEEYSKFIYGEISRDVEIDIFGEYVNQCVQHHKNVLEQLGFKVNVINHLSIYTENGTDVEGFIKSENDNYLSIIKRR